MTRQTPRTLQNSNQMGLARSLSGTTTLLTAFTAAVLTVFAMLSVSQASADARRAKTAAETAKSYAVADARGEELLSALRRGETPEGCLLSGENTWTFSVPIDNTKEISAKVRIFPDKSYEILSWQMHRTVPWEPGRNPFDDIAKPNEE